MEAQILGILTEMHQQMGRIERDVSVLKEDVTHIKESIQRIEITQNDDTVALLKTINGKVDLLQQRQEESDRVVDLHSILITRMQAHMMMSG
ncbi:hypothetical protein ACAF76_013545 [Brevibacillus sp. TJ4]|uniref:hypothetical protein n=1 Tax=Brevibacillus sp. TJ4 TaxID=3234853 RepID=UPI003B9EFAD0